MGSGVGDEAEAAALVFREWTGGVVCAHLFEGAVNEGGVDASFFRSHLAVAALRLSGRDVRLDRAP